MAYLKILDSAGRKIRAYTAYEAAGAGRRLSNWGTSNAGPNSTLFSSLSNLRSRSRELSRNDPQINGALDCLVSNIVGMGISPRWQLSNSKLKKSVAATLGGLDAGSGCKRPARFLRVTGANRKIDHRNRRGFYPVLSETHWKRACGTASTSSS